MVCTMHQSALVTKAICFSARIQVALSGTSFSDDGTLFAYGLSQSGSDWIKIKFKDVKTGNDLEDVLEHVKFSCMSWTHDNKGIFYNRLLL